MLPGLLAHFTFEREKDDANLDLEEEEGCFIWLCFCMSERAWQFTWNPSWEGRKWLVMAQIFREEERKRGRERGVCSRFWPNSSSVLKWILLSTQDCSSSCCCSCCCYGWLGSFSSRIPNHDVVVFSCSENAGNQFFYHEIVCPVVSKLHHWHSVHYRREHKGLDLVSLMSKMFVYLLDGWATEAPLSMFDDCGLFRPTVKKEIEQMLPRSCFDTLILDQRRRGQ